MKIGVLNLEIGNIHSVFSAINNLGFNTQILNNASDLDDCSHLIIPGIGNYNKLMNLVLKKNYGKEIQKFADTNKPILGICAGMQILSTFGYENEKAKGLNLIPGNVISLKTDNEKNDLPHIGWNSVRLLKKNKLLQNIKDLSDFYFVHSYHFELDDASNSLAKTQYLQEFNSIINYKNIFGAQFHPEKSQKNGLWLLHNFCSI